MPTRPILWFLIAVLVGPTASAQTLRWCDDPVYSGPNHDDVLDIPHREALEATRDLTYCVGAAEEAVWWAGFSGDPSLRPLLWEIVDVYDDKINDVYHGPVAVGALAALALLGADPEPIIDYIATYQTDAYDVKWSVSYEGVGVLAAYDDLQVPVELDLRLSPEAAISGGWIQPEPAETAASKALPTIYAQVEEAMGFGVEAYESWRPVSQGDTLRRSGSGSDAAYDSATIWTLSRLRDIATTYPDSFRVQVPQVVATDPWVTDRIRISRMDPEAVIGWALKAGLPHEPYPRPPANASANVVPLLECVENKGDGTLTAVFGYENLSGSPVSVPYGSSNTVSPAAQDGRQPSAFGLPRSIAARPGRTPLYPGFAWQATFAETDSVSWSLPGGTVTARASSRPCALSNLTALPAASLLASDSLARIQPRGDGFLLSGYDHDLAGTALGTPPERHGIATATASDAATVLSRLAGDGKEAHVVGLADSASVVAVTPPPFDAEDLAVAFLAHPSVVALGDTLGQTLGSTTAPVVAHASGDLVIEEDGYGVLVVDGDVVFRKKTWHGLIVVRGASGVTRRVTMRSASGLIGGLVMGQPGDGGVILDMGGSSSILYSTEAVGLAQSLLPVP